MKKISLLAALICLSFQVFAFSPVFSAADALGEATPQVATADVLDHMLPGGHWFVGANIGHAWNDSSAKTVRVPNKIGGAPPQYSFDAYTLNHVQGGVIWGLQGGYRWFRPYYFFPTISVGAQFFHLGSGKIAGNMRWLNLYPRTYRVDTSSNFLGVFGQVDLYQFYHFSPFFKMGVGLAGTRLSNYHESQDAGVLNRTSPAFGAKTNYHLAYSIGFGVDYYVFHFLRLSLGYEHLNLGAVQTSKGGTTLPNQSLSLGKLKSNLILFGLDYQLP